ncbi:hypothetical protein [Phormidesmis sp. 146-12]
MSKACRPHFADMAASYEKSGAKEALVYSLRKPKMLWLYGFYDR